jgi:translocation and assembly module TamA
LRQARAVCRLAFFLLSLCAASAGRAEVVLEGIDGRLADNVRAQLGLLELECESPPWLVRWQYRAADRDVREALEAVGYYDPRIETRLEFPDSGCWQAHIVVEPGEPVRVASVTIEILGNLEDEPDLRGPVDAGLAMRDKILDHGRYERTKRVLLEAARNLGYFDAKLTANEVLVAPAARRADILIRIDGGERYRFGAISVSQDVIAHELLDALVPFETGDVYRVELIGRLQRNLNSSGYFGHVGVIAEPASTDRTVPVQIDAMPPSRRWTYGVGAGYATDTGVRLRADADNPRVNRRGHRLEVSGMTSQVRSDIDASYRIPHKDPLSDWFAFNVAVAHEDTDTQRSDISKLAAQHSYERWGWVQVDFVELNYEEFNIADQAGESRLVLVGSSLARVWRDEPVRPTRGLRLSGTLRGAAQTLGSDTDFVQARLAAKAIHRLTTRTRVLVRGEAGWTWKDEFSDLPPSVRYFAGGDASVRGYDYQSLGEERDGEVIGGSGLLTGSVELDWLFRERWSIAAFADTGSAYDREPTFSTGIGAGIRWYSPLGAVRVDIAHPLDDPSKEWRLHVSLGPDL